MAVMDGPPIQATAIMLGAFVFVTAGPMSAQGARSKPWILEIGVLDGDEAEIFGRIRDVLVDDSSNVYVLDDQAFTVSWFGPDGGHRVRQGGQEEDPASFSLPLI